MDESDCNMADESSGVLMCHSSSSSSHSSESLDCTNNIHSEEDSSSAQEILTSHDNSVDGSSLLSSSCESSSSTLNRLAFSSEKHNILHCGYLLKLGGTGLVPKHWNKRWFVLRGDNCLYYYRNKGEKPAGAIILSNYLVTSVIGPGTREFTFQLSRGGARTYTLIAFSELDMKTWMQLISECARSDDKSCITPERNVHNVGIPALSIIDPDCHGYIWKRGEIHKSWKKRYAVLKDATLYYYKDMTETTAIGLFRLHYYHVDETESIGRKYGIVAIPPEADMRTFYFATESENDRYRWIRCFRSSIESISSCSTEEWNPKRFCVKSLARK